jgi:DNA processing protein
MTVMVKSFADLGAQLQQAKIPDLLKLLKAARYVEVADALDKLQIPQEMLVKHGDDLSYAYYRRALVRQSDQSNAAAIKDLERALSFPGVTDALRLLIRSRLIAIQSIGSSPDVHKFDECVAGYFGGKISDGGLLAEFLMKHSLHQPQRLLRIPFVDGMSSVSVYRWKADEHYGETWSKLIRQAKKGDQSVLPCFGRLLAEHAGTRREFRSWMQEIDFVVPVPANPQRAAERHVDIVSVIASSFADRLGLPVRSDLLKRTEGARAREVDRSTLSGQYRIDPRKGAQLRNRTVLIIDDVVTKGNTASICAERLKELGCQKVYLLTLAQSESTAKSSAFLGESVSGEAQELAGWLCLADTDKLGPVRLKALLKRFKSPEIVLKADVKPLRDVQDIGPKLAEAIVGQAEKADEYAIKATDLLNAAKRMGGRILTLQDADYPSVLRASNAAPAIVYALGAGTSALHSSKTVAIVGTRNPTAESVTIAKRISATFAAAGWIVVSGMAEGVDSLAHAAALDQGRPTVAYLGNGVDVTYPPSAKHLRQEILRHGVLLSEYAFGSRTNENQLRRRNSLTVGAAKAVIIIQTTDKGGTMNAARAAKLLGRPLFCVEPPAGLASQFGGNAMLLESNEASRIDPDHPVEMVQAAIEKRDN